MGLGGRGEPHPILTLITTSKRGTMNKRTVRILTLVAAMGFAACDEDSGPLTTGDPLSEAEATALASFVLNAAFQSTSGLPSAPAAVDGPQAAPFSFSTDVSVTVPCDEGGTVAISGSASVNGDDETNEYLVDYEASQAFDGCVAIEAETEQTFTLNGSVGMVATADLAMSPEQELTFAIETSITGSLDWESGDGRSGTCGISITSQATSTGQAITATTEGSACGVSVSETFTYGLPS